MGVVTFIKLKGCSVIYTCNVPYHLFYFWRILIFMTLAKIFHGLMLLCGVGTAFHQKVAFLLCSGSVGLLEPHLCEKNNLTDNHVWSYLCNWLYMVAIQE